jgi:hypothetical protein
MVKRREKLKRELIMSSMEIFEKRLEVDDWAERIFVTPEEIAAQQAEAAASTQVCNIDKRCVHCAWCCLVESALLSSGTNALSEIQPKRRSSRSRSSVARPRRGMRGSTRRPWA